MEKYSRTVFLAWTLGLFGALGACGGDAPSKSDPRDGDASADQDGGQGDGGGDAASSNGGDGGGDGSVPLSCGDGESDPKDDAEECDDGNRLNGDGCSGACKVEAGWLCPAEGGTCAANCGDGQLRGNEQCDDGNSQDGDGCGRSCKLEPGYYCPDAGEPCVAAACGDGIIAGDEACDDADQVPGDGCGVDCQVEPGWVCVGALCSAAECGDGIIAGKEVCDDGNAMGGDGCLADCSGVEPFYVCDGAGPCTPSTDCGDGIVAGNEPCDDGNDIDGDGCTGCRVDYGYVCPGGQICAPLCGDGKTAGAEQCDDGGQCNGGSNDGADCTDDAQCDSGDCAPQSNDGCASDCTLEPGFKCEDGAGCEPAVCGNGEVEGLEECDDGDPLTGPDNNLGDGCTPFCKLEPDCSGGACLARCGDGIWQDTDEECDDGNQRNNDGCSSTCEFEPGYRCEVVTETPQAQVSIPVVYRDFRAHDFRVGSACTDDGSYCESDGDCGNNDCSSPCGGSEAHCCDADEPGCAAGHPDFQNRPNGGQDMVNDTLDADGKPTRTGSGGGSIDSDASFYDWYRDSDRNLTVVEEMTLDSCPGGSCNSGTGLCEGGSLDGEDCGTYVFSNGNFYPLTGKGFNDPDLLTGLPGAFDEVYDACGTSIDRNFHFTSEVRYWFEYEGDEVLQFTGDDDVWVYINGQLAVDIGGIHGAQDGCISLRADQAGCESVTASRRNRRTAAQLGLEVGKIYEVVVFQAERNTCESNYRLTLAGFFTSRTECQSFCGDGVVTPGEICDDGSLCSGPPAVDGDDCGVDADAELMCTSGGGTCESQNELMTIPYGGCDMCIGRGSYCGDGMLDDLDGEQCDLGAAQNDGSYEGCRPNCTFGPVCGDGNTDGPHEQCDDGDDNVDGVYGKCGTDCAFGPRCGDEVVQTDQGEQCDNGPSPDPFDGCTPDCKLLCGDGVVQMAFGEQCDDGTADNDGSYGGCKADCTRAAYCGDGKVQAGKGEECDDGNANSFDGCSATCKNELVLQ